MSRERLRERLAKILDRIAGRIEADRALCLAILVQLYLLLVLPRSFRPLWFDEIYTYNLTTLPDLRAVWHALMVGADSNPPLFHVVTRAATALFGTTELSLRLPAILGFLLLSCCLYLFVSRRCGACYGFAAMLLPWVTGAFTYASEARPYGLLLGQAGLAIVIWQRAEESRRRSLTYLCMAAVLSAAVLTHYFGVLLLVPFAIAQIVRDYRRQKVDYIPWICLTVPLAACAVYVPILTSVQPSGVVAHHANNVIFRPTWHSLPDFWNFLLAPALWPIAIGAFIIAFGAAGKREEESSTAVFLREDEIALALGFLLLPVIEIVLGYLALHVFFTRYGTPAVIGAAILFGMAAAKLTNRSRPVGAALVAFMVVWIVGSTLEGYAAALTQPPVAAVSLDQRTDLPLVVSSGLIYYEMNHYAPLPLARRMWYLSDSQTALRLTGADVFEGFQGLNRMFPLRANIADYQPFVKVHHRFLVYGYASHGLDWLVTKLQEDGARLTYLGQRNEEFGPAVLHLAEMPDSVASSVQ